MFPVALGTSSGTKSASEEAVARTPAEASAPAAEAAETPAALAETLAAPTEPAAPAPEPAAPAEQGKEALEKPEPTEPAADLAQPAAPAKRAAAGVQRKLTRGGTEHVQGPRDDHGRGPSGRTGASRGDGQVASVAIAVRVDPHGDAVAVRADEVTNADVRELAKIRGQARAELPAFGRPGARNLAIAMSGRHVDEDDESDESEDSDGDYDGDGDFVPPLADEEDEDDAAAAYAAALEKLRVRASESAKMGASERRTQFLKEHEEACDDSSTRRGVATCVAEIMKQMTNSDKPCVAANPDAADNLSAALRAWVEDPENGIVGAISDPGASLRVDAGSPFAVALSWARASNVLACFNPEEIGKIEGEEGKRMLWLAFAQFQKRDMCPPEKCATYVCTKLLVKMFHMASSGGTFRDNVSFHTLDLCAALTERDEVFVETKSADGERTFSSLKATDGWEELAEELTPLTLGAFLLDLDGNGNRIIVLASKAVIVLARAYYESLGFTFEMWPDWLIACAGVHPLLVRLDGSEHADGMPAYGVGQVSTKDGRVFLVACVIAAGDGIYGNLAVTLGGAQHGAVHLTATVNVLISVCTNGKLVEYDDESCAFVANKAVKAEKMRDAVEYMMSGDYAKDLAAKRSLAGKKAAETRHAKKDDDGGSIAGKKAAETRHARKDDDGKSIAGKKAAETTHARKDDDGGSIAGKKAAETRHAKKDDDGGSNAGKKAAETLNAKKRATATLMHVTKYEGKTKTTFGYQKTTTFGRQSGYGFDSEVAAAVGLNDCLASLRLSPENERWFNEDEERKKEWKEEWRQGDAQPNRY